jgi:hypothetical protein
LHGGGAHLEEEGRIYYPSFAHQERRTCQIRMRSDAWERRAWALVSVERDFQFQVQFIYCDHFCLEEGA